MIKKLEWDSHFFNLNVGELDFENYNDSLDYADYNLLYVYSSSDFNLKLKEFENSFSEQKLKFSKELKEVMSVSDKFFSYKETAYDIQQVYELAYESGKYSRFLLDKNFNSNKFQELYRMWIDNTISKNFAEDIFLYKEKEATVGLLSYKINENNGFVGLIAISSKHQGKGIRSLLLKHLETVLYKKGIYKLVIPTHAQNQQACYFYTKQGYSISANICQTLLENK